MRTGPKNTFSFFDRRKPVMRGVVTQGFSAVVLNTPFLTLTGLKPAKMAKPNQMNVLHRVYMKNSVCRVCERTSERASISPVYLFLGVPCIVAEQTPVVLIDSLRAPEPYRQLTCFPEDTQN
jgi:hypothetical protein